MPKQLLLSFLAGSFMSFGAGVAVVLADGAGGGTQKLLGALGFMTGFVALFVSGAAAFTEVNVVLPFLMMRQFDGYALLKQFRFWLFVWVGNLAGALLVAVFFNCVGVFTSFQMLQLETLLVAKLRYRTMGGAGWWKCFLSGILCNWMFGMASFAAAKSRIIVSTVVAVFFPVLVFVALSLEHTIANMSLFTIYLTYTIVAPLPNSVTWGDFFAWSLVPSSLGNMIGAFVLVSLVFSFTVEGPLRCSCARSKKQPAAASAFPGDAETL